MPPSLCLVSAGYKYGIHFGNLDVAKAALTNVCQSQSQLFIAGDSGHKVFEAVDNIQTLIVDIDLQLDLGS